MEETIFMGLFIIAIIVIASKTANAKDKSIDDSASDNMNAFLKMIQFAEGTFRQPNPYAVVFGYGHIIKNFDDHPAITGEWKGKKLSDALCRGAGLGPGCKSTAAGAFQIIKPTWLDIKRQMPFLKFDKKGQEDGAFYLIEQKGAVQDIYNGAFDIALMKCNKIWASLPGSPYGQPTRSFQVLQEFYIDQGGHLLVV